MNLTLRVANYMSRYAPSKQKISEYLSKKKCEDIPSFLAEIHYDEALMIQLWMRTFLTLGKGKREIEMKLRKKGFSIILICENIEHFLIEIEDWDIQKDMIIRQIDTLLHRGKSRRMIEMLLVEKYPYFREGIRSFLLGSEDADALQKEMQKYKNRYNFSDKNDRNKLFAALMRKGFEYNDIKKQIETTFL